MNREKLQKEIEERLEELETEINYHTDTLQYISAPIDYTTDLCFYINRIEGHLDELKELRDEYFDLECKRDFKEE